MKKILCPAIAALLPFASSAIAAPFNSLDARAMAMGDTGVAASQPGSAPIFNGALMSQNAGDETVSIILPNAGASVYADEDALEAFQNIDDDEYLDNLSAAIEDFEDANGDIGQTRQSARDISVATSGLNKELSNLNGKPFNVNAGALFSVVVPTELIGVGVYADTQAVIETSPIVTACDTALFDKYTEVADNIADASADPARDYVSECGDKVYDGATQKFIDPTNTNDDESGENEETYLTTSIAVAGATISEFGVALSHKFNVNDTEFSLSVTPKMQEITSYYALPSLEDLTDDDYELSDTLEDNEKTESAFNVDLGFAMGFLYNDALVVGLTLKNLLGETYETKKITKNQDGSERDCSEFQCSAKFDLKPQARAGVAWDLPLGFTVASDLDLTTNKALFNGQDTQYFGLGAEWDGFNIIRLRAGVRTNFEDSDDTALTAGLGFNIVAFHLDLGAQFSENNAGAALQMGVEF